MVVAPPPVAGNPIVSALMQLPGWLDPAAPHRFEYLRAFENGLCARMTETEFKHVSWRRANAAGHRDGTSCRSWLGEVRRSEPGPMNLTNHPYTVGELWRIAGRPDQPGQAGGYLLDAATTLWCYSGLLSPPEALFGVLHICCEFPTIPGGSAGTIPDPRELADFVGAVWPYLPRRRLEALARLLTRTGRLRTPG